MGEVKAATKTQRLYWLPEGARKNSNGCYVIEMPDQPKSMVVAIWSLVNERAKSRAPKLPFKPVHHKNACLEMLSHDWCLSP